MRKRHAARPMLESMEDRLVLSAAGVLDPTSHAHAAIVKVAAQHARATTAQADHHATTHAARSRAEHRQPVKTTHQATKKSSSSTSSLSNTFSNFFKSLGL